MLGYDLYGLGWGVLSQFGLGRAALRLVCVWMRWIKACLGWGELGSRQVCCKTASDTRSLVAGVGDGRQWGEDRLASPHLDESAPHTPLPQGPHATTTHLGPGGGDGCVCPHCGKILSDKYKVRRHIEDVHTPSSHGHECSLCHRKYKTRNTLQNHMSIYHRPPRRPRNPPATPTHSHTHTHTTPVHHHHPHIHYPSPGPALDTATPLPHER